MLQQVKFLALTTALVVLPACSWFSKKEEATAPAANAAPVVRVINVLDEKYYKDAHIKGSVQVNYDKVEEAAAGWDKNDIVVVYCANYACAASGDVARKLKAMGFDARAYEGGMAEWIAMNKAGDATFAYEGPAQEGYIADIGTPHAAEEGVVVITAADLKDLMTKANLL